MLGKDNRLDVATYRKVRDYAHPAWREQRNQVIQNGIGCRLMADLSITILIDVEFQAP